MRIEAMRNILAASGGVRGQAVPVFFVLLVLAVGGCSSVEYADLQEYTTQVKAKPPGRIPPIPEFETYETFAYQASDLRDPFTPREEATLERAKTGKGTGLQPDLNRHKETLENFPLDGLEFVGTLENAAEMWAIIRAPDDFVYRAKVGNHMGQNFGEIVSVDESRVQLVEIVPDGMGGWMKRQAALAIEE
jgi:type IV pilus assembly protein PilP